MELLGKVHRWQDENGIMYAANEFLRVAWAYTDDPEMVGKLGWHGPDQICVEYIMQPAKSE